MNADELISRFEARLPDSLELLRRLVECESCSIDKEGVDRLADMLSREFDARRARCRVLRCKSRGNALYAEMGPPGLAPVLLLGHLDTVWPRGSAARNPFRIEEGRAFGPGVYDMKSGILLCLLVCEAISSAWIEPRRPVRVLLTADEELGTETGLEHIRVAAHGAAAVLCLEPPLPGGKAKTSRKGVGILTVRVIGRSAHAGVDHELGANAIVELCRQLVRIQALTDYARGITVSVGTIRGGTAPNVVPDRAEAVVDFRVPTAQDAAELEWTVRDLKPEDCRCTLSVEGGLERPPLVRSAGVVALYETARAAAAASGFHLGEGATGGGSDGSITAALGVPTLDGLGIDGDGAHAEHEHIVIGDLPRRAAFLSRLVASL
jgi:glutamate carboxypeptidase